MKKKFIYLSLFLVSLFCLVGTIAINIYNSNNLATTNQNNIVVDIIENNSNKMSLSKRYAQNESGDNVVEVTATVSPSDAEDTILLWDLKWSDDSTEDTTSYIEMVVSDDTHAVSLTYLAPFNTQLILIASASSDVTITASCTIDCYKRTFDCDTIFTLDETIQLNCNDDENYFDFSIYSNIFSDFKLNFPNIILIQNGTIEVESSQIITLKLSHELSEKLSNYFDGSLVKYTEFDFQDIGGLSFEQIFSIIFNDNPNEELPVDLYTALSETDYWFDLVVTTSDKVNDNVINEFEVVYQLKGLTVESVSLVHDVNLNQENIIF